MSDKQIVEVIRSVLNRGNNVEIRKGRGGDMIISEVKKNKVVS